MHLAQFADRLPSQLSGGQRQRMALARALAVEPTVLLLDEPFGALDAKVRKELRDWLRRLHDEVHVTTVFVTHDQEEALEVADEIVVINEGRIEQIGTPDELYDEPANRFVMSFLGEVTTLGRPPDPAARHHASTPARCRTRSPATVVRTVRIGFEVRDQHPSGRCLRRVLRRDRHPDPDLRQRPRPGADGGRVWLEPETGRHDRARAGRATAASGKAGSTAA